MAASGSILGTRVQRVEDPSLLRGRGTFIDNVAPRDALYLTFVRAMTAHGRIGSIEVDDARAMPGVVAVFTADDLDLEPLTSSALLDHSVAQHVLGA